MKKLLLLLSLTLFLSQGGYSYELIACPRPDLPPLPPNPSEEEMEIAKKNLIEWMRNETGEYDSEGKKHGFWIYRVRCQHESGTYVHGKRQGEWYKSGKGKGGSGTSVRSTYKDDKLHGLWSSSNFNGGESGNYKNGKLDGKWTEYGIGFAPSRRYRIEGNYKDGKKDGKWTFWDGWKVHKEKEGNYKDDKKDGKWTTWYKNGQIESESHWKDGECISGDC